MCSSVSVSTHRTSVAVHQYTYQHVGPWTQHAGPSRGLFGTHMTTLVLGLSTLTLPVNCSGDFGPRGLSGQYTQDVRGCPPAHTGYPWLSVCVRVCSFVSVSTHRTSVAVHQYTYQHIGPWTQHAGPSRGLFGTHRTSVGVRKRTQHVCGCPWLTVSTHRTSVAVRVCPCVCLFSTHRTSVGVRQHTQDVRGCPSSVAVRVCPCVSVGVRQHTQDVCSCLWLSVSTHRTSVCVRQHTQDDVYDCPCVSVSTHRTSVGVRQHTQDVCVTLALLVDCLGDFGPRGLSVQYTQDVRGCPPAHIGRLWMTSGAVRVCPCVSVSTHRTSVAVHQYTYKHHFGPWTQYAGPSRGLFGSFWPTTHRTSVGVRQYTQDVRGCPWLSVSTHRTSVTDIRGCPCVYVCVRVCPSEHTGRPWLSISTHISTLVLGLSTLTLPVDCSGDFGPRGLFVQYTQDVRGCSPAHTGRRPWLSMCVRVCPSAHTGRLWLSISSHISIFVLGLSTLALSVDCFVHTGRPWVSASTHRTSVAVRQHTQDVRGCPCVSLCVRQHTQ
ncbi:unnamed protein product, partial [Brassica rapa]